MYIVETRNKQNEFRYSRFDTLVLAQGFAKQFRGKIYQSRATKNWSRYRFEFDEENSFDREYYEENGWEKEKIDVLEKYEGIPSFYILNLDDPSDERNCGPEGWVNSMEMCYEAPSGMSVEEAKQFLLDLGMIEGIPPHEERF